MTTVERSIATGAARKAALTALICTIHPCHPRLRFMATEQFRCISTCNLLKRFLAYFKAPEPTSSLAASRAPYALILCPWRQSDAILQTTAFMLPIAHGSYPGSAKPGPSVIPTP